MTTAAACAVAAMTIPAGASVSSGPAAAGVPHGLLPMAASWTTAQNGIVLAYPSRTTGARPYLLETGNGGKSWQSLPAPPVKYPEDNDQPDAVWSGGVIAVTDGTHIVASRDSGKHWTAERLTGAPGSAYVAQVAIADGRVFALAESTKSATVYSGTAQSGALRAVPGLTIAGSGNYGDIAVAGALQVDLGNAYTAEKYWYSMNGTSFTAAPLPCPVTDVAWLGGVRSGQAVAFCSDTPSAIAPGETDAQLAIAPRLGGKFTASGTRTDIPNFSDFAAASAQAMTAATEAGLTVTTSAGKTWAAVQTQPNGAFWSDLSFPTATTGFVVCSTVDNSLKEVDTVYRTTNSGKTWSAVPLP
ncbi:MAG: hypothetical protein ACRDN0_14210 [Trebonia sp.]